MKVSAKAILDLLATRHADDVFISECKDGPTHYSSHNRMDAWVMPRSWAKPWTTAYEIKVSRSDFLKDDKWPAYLDCCHYFYFVCPWGVIEPSETPDQAGLMFVSKAGSRLYTKKKAPLREVTLPEDLFRYVLMARAKIQRDGDCVSRSGADRWRDWLKETEENRELGYQVRGRIAELYREIQQENERLKRAMQSYDWLRERLREHGKDPDSFAAYEAANVLEDLTGSNAWREARRRAGWLREALDKFDAYSEKIESGQVEAGMP